MSRLKWSKLLNDTRIRDLSGGPDEDSGSENDSFLQPFLGPDHRSQFDRDYDRSLFSTPVRRLHDKAQVFPLEPNDSVRTRGTHSAEVSNVAQSIAQRIGNHLVKEGEIYKNQASKIEAIASTCGLLHDLGNPPFGHAGEEAMKEWFQALLDDDDSGVQEALGRFEGGDLTQDFRKFDGNAQTIRLVSTLQMLADFHGLNLTAGTLAAAVKYVSRSDQTGSVHTRDKPGYFFSEAPIVQAVREKTGLAEGVRHPITFFVEASDDIVYSVVDLEDGIKKKTITWEQLKAFFTDEEDKLGVAIAQEAEKNVKRRLREADLGEDGLSPQGVAEANAQMFRTLGIAAHVSAVVATFKHRYQAIIKGKYDAEMLQDRQGSDSVASDGELGIGATREFLNNCKSFARAEVFTYPDILERESQGRRIIQDLLDFFWKGARDYPYRGKEKKSFACKAYSLMSENYRLVFERNISPERIEETGLPREYRQLQLVADYICGMTDGFAQSLHKDLFNG